MVAVNAIRSTRVAGDGRRRRWDEHKKARRAEFVDAALVAIRREGPGIGMEAVAAEVGVSKTVLYRHFTDKRDLVGAVLHQIAQTVLLPPLLAELAVEREDPAQVRALIGAYVHSVAAEPELYRFIFAHTREAGDAESVVATTERVVAEALSAVVGDRLRALGMDSGGAQPWSYGIVGLVRLATHWWVDNPTMSSAALVDYLTMLVWGGLEGVLKSEGSPARFVPELTTTPVRRLLGSDPDPEPPPSTGIEESHHA